MRLLFSSIALSALLAGCAFDHRKEFAYSVLYRPNGMENDKAFSAAVSALFPPGSPLSALEAFAKANAGECHSREPDGYVCEFATRGHFCAARLVQIHATVEGNAIKSVAFVSGGLGC